MRHFRGLGESTQRSERPKIPFGPINNSIWQTSLTFLAPVSMTRLMKGLDERDKDRGSVKKYL